MQPHQWYLLKLTNYRKAKSLYEVIFFLYSIRGKDLTESQILEGVDGKERCDLFQGELQLLHKK